MTRAMNSDKLGVDVMNRKVIKCSLGYRELLEFQTGMKDVGRIREEKDMPALDYYQQYETVEYDSLRPVYTANKPNITPGMSTYQIGLEEMRYLDEVECMKVELEANLLITVDQQPYFTSSESKKFHKRLKVVNDYRVECKEIRLILTQT